LNIYIPNCIQIYSFCQFVVLGLKVEIHSQGCSYYD